MEEIKYNLPRKFPKIICVMAAHGRSGITTETIKILQKQTWPIDILMVGDSNIERGIANKTGCMYIQRPNKPLGNKWQEAVYYAKTLDPDALMICGSDSWLSYKWCEIALPFVLYDNQDLVGINMFHACKVYPNEKVRIIRRAYKDRRKNIPMGSGRIFSKKILDKANWHIFPKNKNRAMDINSYRKVKELKGNIKIIESEDMKILTIKSTWESINSWEKYVKSKRNKVLPDIKNPKAWLAKEFPGSIGALTRVVDNILW